MTATAIVRERYPTARAFLAALHEFWGARAFVQNGHDPAVFHARCPSCTASGDHPSERYVLDLEAREHGGWRLSTIRCGCSGESILGALERALASRHADAADHYARRALDRLAQETA